MVLFFYLFHHQPSLLVLRRYVTQSDLSWAKPRSVCFLHTQPPHCPTNIRTIWILIALYCWDFVISCYLALSWPWLTETVTKSEFKLRPLTPNPYSLFLCHTKTESRTFSKITQTCSLYHEAYNVCVCLAKERQMITDNNNNNDNNKKVS